MKVFVADVARAMAICSLAVAAAAHAETPKPVTIKPGKAFEKCLTLVPPQKLEYRFESAAKIDFNLHYHKGEQVYYPVKLDRTNAESGSYEAKANEVYCLMWENKTSAAVELTYSARIAK
jgi:hypothetical protein